MWSGEWINSPSSYPVEEMNSFLGALSGKPRLPVIATNRPSREMGAFVGREDVRLRMLEDAAKSGADWIDLEYDACIDMIAPLQAGRSKGSHFLAQPG